MVAGGGALLQKAVVVLPEMEEEQDGIKVMLLQAAGEILASSHK